MGHTTIRIREETHAQLKKLARDGKSSIQGVVEQLIREHEDNLFFDSINKGYDAIWADPKAAAEELELRRFLDALSADAMKNEPPYRVSCESGPAYPRERG